MNGEIADFLYSSAGRWLEELEKDHTTTIIPVARDGFRREQYEIVKSGETVHG